MAKRTRPPGLPQDSLNEFERFYNSPRTRELREQFQRWVDSPRGREMREAMRRIDDSPFWRELRQARPKDEEPPPPKPSTPKIRRARTKGGGRKPSLTNDEIKQLRDAYRTIRRNKPALSQKRVFTKLRGLLPEGKRSISDTTLRDHIAPPRPHGNKARARK